MGEGDRPSDPVDRERLIEEHLPLARAVARRHATTAEPFEDLVQVASLGLVAAARRYDPSRGVPFAAYAVPTIDGELRRYLRDLSSTVRVPRRQQALASVLRRAASAASQRLGREVSVAEAAEAAGVAVGEAELALGATAPSASLGDLEYAVSDAADAELEACERRVLFEPILTALQPREREALGLRFAGDLSQQEIARRMHISQSQASRLLARALEKVRQGLEREESRAA
jgi:RNA polymerase sigma-B factor